MRTWIFSLTVISMLLPATLFAQSMGGTAAPSVGTSAPMGSGSTTTPGSSTMGSGTSSGTKTRQNQEVRGLEDSSSRPNDIGTGSPSMGSGTSSQPTSGTITTP